MLREVVYLVKILRNITTK